MTELSQRTKRLTGPERRGFIERLLATERIYWNDVESERGRDSWCFWPVRKTVAADTPAVKIEAALAEAVRLMTAGLEQVATAIQLLREPSAVTPATGLAVETADAAEGELRTAC